MDFGATDFWPWPCHYRTLKCFYKLCSLNGILSSVPPISTSFLPSPPLPLPAHLPGWLLLCYILGISTVSSSYRKPPQHLLSSFVSARQVRVSSSRPPYCPEDTSIVAVSTRSMSTCLFSIRMCFGIRIPVTGSSSAFNLQWWPGAQ